MTTNTGTTTGSTAITLVTDTHTGNTNTDQIVLRQSETGQSLQVTLELEDGTPYDLTNCLVTFSENKNDGKMISDDNIQVISAKAGTFTYQFNQAVYQTSGTAWFDITDNTRKLITTTVNFSIKIIDPIDLPINNTSYWSTAQSLLTHISANMSKWQNDIDQAELNTKSQLDGLIKKYQDSLAQYSALLNTYDDKFTSLQSSWQNQIDSLSKNTAEQAAADFKTQRDALENEFTDFERQLKKDLSNKLLDVNEALTSISETNVPQVNESINAVAKKVADLTNQLNDFDFSKYATHKELAALAVKIDSMYTNSKIDSMLSAVGTVKSVNGQKPDGSGNVLVAAGKVKTVNGQGPDNNGNINIGTGKVQSVNGNKPDQDGDVHVPSYAPNLLLGTQSKPKTVEMSSWSANADIYSIDPSIDLSGQKVTVSIKLAKSTNDAIVVLQYTDSTGAWHFPWGNVIPAGNTGYSTVTQVLPANVKNIGVRPSWTNGTAKGTCTYSEAKLAVWKSASLPPDMTWVPNEADKAEKSDVTVLQSMLNNIDSTRTPIVAGNSGDDLFAFKTSQIRLYNGNGSTCKNLPPAVNTRWFSVQYVFEGTNDNGIAIYRTPANEIWTAGCNGGVYSPWVRLANSNDISGTIVTDYNIESKTPTKETNRYTNRWLVDQNALGAFADQINQLKSDVTAYAPNLLLGTQSKPKTVEMSSWSANADIYSIDPSIDLSGQKVTVSIKLAKSTNDAIVVLQYTDSTGAWHFPWGNVIPAGNTGYSTVTQVLPANVKNIGVRPSWTNGTAKGTCTYSEAKLAVWKSASLPPDMTWVPNEADKANQSDLINTNNRVTAIEAGYMKKPTVISQADYDKLPTKDPNTLYEITE